MKIISAFLLIILIAVLVFDFYIVSQNKTPSPTPSQTTLSSAPPIATSSPREVNPEVPIKYNEVRPKVDIRNYSTNPSTLTVKINTVVTWTNYDKDPHQIVGDKWESFVIKETKSFSQAFEKPGSYPYKDPQNPQLNGVIIVEP